MLTSTILIVEDEADDRDAVLHFLEKEGYSALAASNGREALELISRFGLPKVMLLDLAMPEMNGWEFLDARKQNQIPDTLPIYVFSAEPASERPKGISGVLSKPVDLKAILNAIRKHCEI